MSYAGWSSAGRRSGSSIPSAPRWSKPSASASRARGDVCSRISDRVDFDSPPGGRFSRFLEGCTYISSSLPGIVVALAFVTVSIRYLHPLYQTVTVVIAAYALLFLPRALVNLRTGGFAQAPIGLEEAAQSLGLSPPLSAFFRVTLPLAAPPATAAGGALVFLGDRERADRHPPAGADRHPHAVHAILVAEQRDRLRRRRTVCVHHDRAVAAHDLRTLHPVEKGSRTMTNALEVAGLDKRFGAAASSARSRSPSRPDPPPLLSGRQAAGRPRCSA